MKSGCFCNVKIKSCFHTMNCLVLTTCYLLGESECIPLYIYVFNIYVNMYVSGLVSKPTSDTKPFTTHFYQVLHTPITCSDPTTGLFSFHSTCCSLTPKHGSWGHSNKQAMRRPCSPWTGLPAAAELPTSQRVVHRQPVLVCNQFCVAQQVSE